MRHVDRLAATLGLALVLAGAGGCADDEIAALEATRARVCACTDAACVKAALDALGDRPTKDPRRAEALARDITDCAARVYQRSDAAIAPDAAGPAAADAAPTLDAAGPAPTDAATAR